MLLRVHTFTSLSIRPARIYHFSTVSVRIPYFPRLVSRKIRNAHGKIFTSELIVARQTESEEKTPHVISCCLREDTPAISVNTYLLKSLPQNIIFFSVLLSELLNLTLVSYGIEENRKGTATVSVLNWANVTKRGQVHAGSERTCSPFNLFWLTLFF